MPRFGLKARQRRALISLGLASLLTACAGVEPLPPSQAAIPGSESLASSPLVTPRWPQLFQAPSLQPLIREALAHNQDFKAARSRLEAAFANTEGDSRWPTINAEVNRQRRDNDGIKTDSASAALSVNWELDVWGRLAAENAVAAYTAQSLAADTQWAQYSLAANVAKAWLTAVANHAQWQLSQQRQASLEQSTDIIENGYENGTRDALEVYSARAELANSAAAELQAQRAFENSRYQLNVLLGRFPGQAIELPESLPAPDNELPAELSSSLLERRPDVRAAQLTLAAQEAQWAVAKRNRWPRFALTAQAGNASDRLSSVASGNDPFWTAIGNLSMPLFQGKALAAEQQRQAHLYEAELANYRSTALTAFQEALNAIDNTTSLHRRWQLAQSASDSARQAEEQALESYLSGISNFNTWLQAQRSAFDSASATITAQSAWLQNRIDLHLALGGDFDLTQEETHDAP
ncbi:outer membrane transport protein, putative [gamma proteobacterium HTCC5015]|nr:outer membrane transport protein, putative [gamma proteobacterium HTCC5015]